MKTIEGDLIDLALNGKFDLIVHGCNCFCAMGAGIAYQIKNTFPEAERADNKTESGDRSKLGTINWVKVVTKYGDLIIVNAYTQYKPSGASRLADYDAIRRAFQSIKQEFSGLRIGYPAIGAGLAKGDWDTIAAIIEEELKDEKHTFVKFNR